ncbi:MAG: WD40 repeat domain-containing protein, partial [Marmoricola sp.]
MRLAAGLVAATLLTGLTVVAPGAGRAAAAGLAVSSVQDTVVDAAHSRIYVSGGGLATADLTGAATGTVAGVSAARQMALTPDGNQLVVANGDGLAVVDAATATLVRTISTGPNSCPNAVAPAAGKMFFTYGDCTDGTPGLGAVDLGTDAVTKSIDTGPVVVQHFDWAADSVVMKSVAVAPNMLVLQAGKTFVVLDAVGGTTPTVAVRTTKTFTAVPGATFAISPDGSEYVTGTGSSQPARAYATADMAFRRTYPNHEPRGIAFRADGRLAMAAGAVGDVGLFAPGSTTETPLTFRATGTNFVSRGLGYGGDQLYVVMSGASGYFITRAPVGPKASITISTDHYAYNYKGTAAVTIKLASPTHSRSVSLFARTEGHDLRFVKTASVGATSRTVVIKMPGLIYNTSFLATFAGDDVYARNSASRAVKVRAKLVISSSSTSVVNGYHRLHPSPAPTLTF